MNEIQNFHQIAATQDTQGNPIIVAIDAQYQPFIWIEARGGWLPMPKLILKQEV